jgi:CubicO group peptidase (beta-lactamase class C family)
MDVRARLPLARRVLRDAIAAGVTPCAVAEVGDRTGAIWTDAVGRLTGDVSAAAASDDTVFDLASLTKVLATTSAAMRLVDGGKLDLRSRVAEVVPAWRGDERRAVTVADLLAHSSGLPAHRPLYRSCRGRAEFERAICAEPLVYRPGTASLYSDLGFILLGFLLERITGDSLESQFARFCEAVGGPPAVSPGSHAARPLAIRFHPPASWADRIAPTRPAPSPPGVPHDENAEALGGIAGHAGLFGTASSVGVLARAVMRAVVDPAGEPALASHETALTFASRADVPGGSRALGWDTMLPSSSCGAHMSARAFGHTGFTGTSLWIDPEVEIYVVLLSNRVYQEPGSGDGIGALRRAFHDAVATQLAFSNRAR